VESGSYPRINLGGDGRAIVTGYDMYDAMGDPLNSQIHVVFDMNPMMGVFGDLSAGSRMDETIERQGNFTPGNNAIWPVMDISEYGSDTVLYTAIMEQLTEQLGAMKVYRKVGTTWADPDVSWTLVFLDTSSFVTQDINCDRGSSKVAVAWIKPTPHDRGFVGAACADVWIAESPNGLSGSWTRTNITNYSGAGYRAWTELSALFDTSGKLHVLWNGAKPMASRSAVASAGCSIGLSSLPQRSVRSTERNGIRTQPAAPPIRML